MAATGVSTGEAPNFEVGLLKSLLAILQAEAGAALCWASQPIPRVQDPVVEIIATSAPGLWTWDTCGPILKLAWPTGSIILDKNDNKVFLENPVMVQSYPGIVLMQLMLCQCKSHC